MIIIRINTLYIVVSFYLFGLYNDYHSHFQNITLYTFSFHLVLLFINLKQSAKPRATRTWDLGLSPLMIYTW